MEMVGRLVAKQIIMEQPSPRYCPRYERVILMVKKSEHAILYRWAHRAYKKLQCSFLNRSRKYVVTTIIME